MNSNKGQYGDTRVAKPEEREGKRREEKRREEGKQSKEQSKPRERRTIEAMGQFCVETVVCLKELEEESTVQERGERGLRQERGGQGREAKTRVERARMRRVTSIVHLMGCGDR